MRPTATISRRFASSSGPFPARRELVRRINLRGGRVVIVTSAKKGELPALLGPIGCDDVIADVVHGGMVRRSKPSPDLFEVAVERAGSRGGLALGDTIWDIQAAKRAAIDCVAVETGGTDPTRLREAGAVAVYSNCDEILGRWDSSPFATLLRTEEMADDEPGKEENLVSRSDRFAYSAASAD